MDGTNIEENGIDLIVLHPDDEVFHITHRQVELAVGMLQRVSLLDSLHQSLHCPLAVFRRKTIVQIFEEVRFTGTEVSVYPYTTMVLLFLLHCRKDIVEALYDFVCENILLYFGGYGFLIEVGSRHCRIDLTFNIPVV